MIHFKNQLHNVINVISGHPKKNGFSTIEAVIALFIIGLFVGTLFKFQATLFRSTVNSHNVLERIPVMSNAFVSASQEGWDKKAGTKQIKDLEPRTKITYKLEKIPQNSSLKKIKNLFLETVAAKWTQPQYLAQDIFISFKFNPEKAEK